MKSIFLATAVTIVSSLALTIGASAQIELGIYEEDMPDLSSPIIINSPTDPETKVLPADINERAQKNFQKEFPSALSPSWYKAEDGYIATFINNDVETKVSYDKKGRYMHTVSYYGEKMLPHDIRHIVKSVYYDYTITRIAEINADYHDFEKIFVVTIRNEKSMKILTICGDAILSVKDYRNN
jgi:hypothetical protein